MARLNIFPIGESRLCVVSGVPMPNGEKRDYAETGKNALVNIVCRIRADKALVKARQKRRNYGDY